MTTLTTADGTEIFFKGWGPKDGQQGLQPSQTEARPALGAAENE